MLLIISAFKILVLEFIILDAVATTKEYRTKQEKLQKCQQEIFYVKCMDDFDEMNALLNALILETEQQHQNW